METFSKCQGLKKVLAGLLILLSFSTGYVQAGFIPTTALINANGESYTQSSLQTALASEQLQQQLITMGVDVEQLSDRIGSLTPNEISQLNNQLDQQPAGGGIIGILLTIFIIFIVTDMLCATNIFSFVKCINK